jgi:hypothetical protein
MIELLSIAVSKLSAESCTGVQISGSGTVINLYVDHVQEIGYLWVVRPHSS